MKFGQDELTVYIEAFKYMLLDKSRISFMVANEKARPNFEVVYKTTPRVEGQEHWFSFRSQNPNPPVEYYKDKELLRIIESQIWEATAPPLLHPSELYWAWVSKKNLEGHKWEEVVNDFVEHISHERYTTMAVAVDEWYEEFSGGEKIRANATIRDIVYAIELQLNRCEF